MTPESSKIKQTFDQLIPLAKSMSKSIKMLLQTLLLSLAWVAGYLGWFQQYSWWWLALPLALIGFATAMLLTLYFTLSEIIELPATLRQINTNLKPAAADPQIKQRRRSLVWNIFSFRGLLMNLIDVLGQYGSFTLLINPIFMLLSAAAAVIAILFAPITFIGVLIAIF